MTPWKDDYKNSNRNKPQQITNIEDEFNIEEIHNLDNNTTHEKQHYEVIKLIVK